jgi:cobalt-zinc-cadmium efflux system protein
MGGNHSHNHAHDHRHRATSHGRAFGIGIALNLAFVAIEATFGILSGSMALVADAATTSATCSRWRSHGSRA